MSEDKSCEIAKMALECLKTKLQTELATAEAQGKTWDFFKTLAEEIGKALPMLMSELGGKKGRVKIEKVFPALTKEDLMFFAKKATLQDLEAIVRDLMAVIDSRKKAEST